MAYLYILKNSKGRYYIGITKLLPILRLERHNDGDVSSTHYGRPWELIYTRDFSNLAEARKQEVKIKSWKGGSA